jgi:hypothetical protein
LILTVSHSHTLYSLLLLLLLMLLLPPELYHNVWLRMQNKP